MSSLSNIAWYKFRRNPLGVLGLTVIFIAFIVSIIGYTFLPDSTPFSNNMHLELSKKEPGRYQCQLIRRLRFDCFWLKLISGIETKLNSSGKIFWSLGKTDPDTKWS